MKRILFLGAACAALAACSSDPLASKTVSLKFQAIGAHFSPTTGFTAGYAAITGHFVPATTPDGKQLLTVAQPCGQMDVISTFANLNSHSTASATSTGSASAPGVQGPAVAAATGDESATGGAARILALGGGAAPTPAALVAYQQACPGAPLPAAPAGSVVEQGEAPK